MDMSTSFSRAITKFSSSQANAIDQKLQAWSQSGKTGYRVAKNIRQSEHFLGDKEMEQLLEFIIVNSSTSIDEFELLFQQECYKLVKQGGGASISVKPKVFCTAIEQEDLITRLIKQFPGKKRPLFKNRRSANDFISQYLMKSKLISYYNHYTLKEYSVWSSWNHENPTGPAYQYVVYNRADEVRANNGLDKLLISKSIYLFTYIIPPSINLYRPTIADAGLYPYFEPPILSENNHGWTVPWHKDHRTKNYILKPRPEIVHDSIKLEDLAFPVIKLK